MRVSLNRWVMLVAMALGLAKTAWSVCMDPSLLSGFENTCGADLSNWTITSGFLSPPLSAPSSFVSGPLTVNPLENSRFLNLTLTSGGDPVITLASGNFQVGAPKNDLTSKGNLLTISYSTVSPAFTTDNSGGPGSPGTPIAPYTSLEIHIVDGSANDFRFNTENISNLTSTLGTKADWKTCSISLNYLHNLGLDTQNISSISLATDFGFNDDGNNPSLFFDALGVDYPLFASGGSAPTPPKPGPDGTITQDGSDTCGKIILKALGTGVVDGNTGSKDGYHIYRSAVSGGPYTSYAYLTVPTATTYTDTGVAFAGSTYYYKVVPYTLKVNVNGTGGNQLVGVWDTVLDPARGVSLVGQAGYASAGPFEVSITTTAEVVGTSTDASGCSASPTQTGTYSFSPTQSLTWTQTPSFSQTPTLTVTPSNSPTLTQSPTQSSTPSNSPSPTVSPAFTETATPTVSPNFTFSDTPTESPTLTNTGSPTDSPTITASPTDSPTGTPSNTDSPTPTYTPTNTPSITDSPTPTYTPTNTPSNTDSPTPTYSPTNTPSNTHSPTVTFSPTQTISCSPTETFTASQTPTPGQAHIYPNPFRPDKGECFRVGNVASGTLIRIYDIIGELVYNSVLPISGSSCPGGWDGNNNNGHKVVTGIYHLVLESPTGSKTFYRVAVIRD